VEAGRKLYRFNWEVLTAHVPQPRVVRRNQTVLNQRSLKRKARIMIMTRETKVKRIMCRIEYNILSRLSTICGQPVVMI
jgi:hypothetical protein